MSATPLRAGVIGLGWAGQQHMKAWAARGDAALVGIAGLEPDTLAELGARYEVPGFAGAVDLLDVTHPDVLSIATPTALHAPIAIAALTRGVHVLTEKPMASTLADADAMVAAARSNDVVCEVVFNHRLRGEVRALADVVAAGTLGPIHHVRAGWQRRRGIPGSGSWFTRQDLAGGGALSDIGIHVLDMAVVLAGYPRLETVVATTGAVFGPRGLGGSDYLAGPGGTHPFDVEDFAAAMLVGPEASISLEVSWAQYRERDRSHLELHGRDGGAVLELSAKPDGVAALTVVTGDLAAPTITTPSFGDPLRHAGVVDGFVSAVRSDGRDGRHGEHGRYLTALVDACYRSAERRGAVVL